MPDDRELISAAARVMGWKMEPPQSSSLEGHYWINRPGMSRTAWWEGCGDDDRCWNPLTKIVDAWMLVQRMRELGYHCSLSSGLIQGTWACQIIRHNERYKPKWILGGPDQSLECDISSDIKFFRGTCEDSSAACAITLAAIAAFEASSDQVTTEG